MTPQIHQSNVPDGMVANVPWGTPFEKWTDRMLERAVKHLRDDDHGSGLAFFPNIYARLTELANKRGLTIE